VLGFYRLHSHGGSEIPEIPRTVCLITEMPSQGFFFPYPQPKEREREIFYFFLANYFQPLAKLILWVRSP
jgi:hypothetical protein